MTKAQRSLVNLLVLLLVAGGLGAWAYFGVHVAQQEEEKRKDAEAKAFEFDKTQAKKLVLTAKGATIELEKAGEGWRIVAPVTAPADKSATDAIVDKLADLKSKATIADDQTDLAAHGLDAPKLTVRLVLADGKEHELRVGEENAFDQSLPYVKSGDGRIFLADSGLKYPLDKALFDLRDKALVSAAEQEVQALESVTPALSWAAERDGTGWKLTAPVTDVADKSTVDGVLSKLRYARAKAFPAEAPPADLKPFGLDAPALQLTYAVGADRAKKSLAFGTADGKAYARHLDGGPIIEVESSLVTDLTKPLADLRDKTIATFDKAKVRRIEIVPAAGEKVAVTRGFEKAEGASFETDTFALVGRTDKLKAWKLTGALHTLSSLKGTALAAENVSDFAPFGLDAPTLTYTLLGEGDQELARVLVGKETGSRVYVAKAGASRVFEVEKTTLDGLPKAVDDLLETPPPPPAPPATPATSETNPAAAAPN